MYNRWQNILTKDFQENNKALVMNCTSQEYLTSWNGGIVRQTPTKEVIKEFAERNNLTLEVAEKYFDHYCVYCDEEFETGVKRKRKKIKSKEVIAMNLKLLGRNTETFYCKKHLMKKITEIRGVEYTQEKWEDDVEKFKNQGCDLF